jgi:hypothetical protein
MSSLDLWQELRGTESAGRLTGREHRLKDPGRIDARVAEDVRVKGRTADEALAAITDRIRFSFCYPSDRYLPGMRADVAELRSRDFTEVEHRNLWEAAVRPGNGQRLAGAGTGRAVRGAVPHGAQPVGAGTLIPAVRAAALGGTRR